MKIISFLLLLALILSMFLLPSVTPILGIVLVTLSLSLAFTTIFRKHRLAYQAGKLTGWRFARNVALEVTGTLLAVALAALLARYAAGLATGPIGNTLLKILAGILVGTLVGMGVGFAVNKLWSRLVRLSPGR
jgi:hypothetical protein